MDAGFLDLQRRLDALIERIDGVDVRVPEDSALISLASDLVPSVTRLLREGIDLLSSVEESYRERSPPEPEIDDDEESLSQIGFQISAELAARDLDNVAFFARTDLRSCHEGLVHAVTRRVDALTLASSCESSLRRLRKALVSVESTLYEFEGLEPPPREWFDVEVSLQIRRLYWNLRRETDDLAESSGKPLEVRLRRVLYRIVAFRELSVYPFLRVDDRVQLRDLLKRILEWLNGDTHDEVEGNRLWRDLASFAELLVQVSHRQELQNHDLGLVKRARRTLFPRAGMIDEVPASLMAELQSLLGRDGEIDRLLIDRVQDDVEAWREPLERLDQTLSHRQDVPAPPELWPE